MSSVACKVPRGWNNNGSQMERFKAWREIHAKLAQWELEPESAADEGIKAPTTAVISAVRELARWMADHDFAAPMWVGPAGDGGIILERYAGGVRGILEIGPTLIVEANTLENDQIVDRYDMPLAQFKFAE